MPAWLEVLLAPIVGIATLYLLAWLAARDALSHRVRFWGWLSVAVTVISMLWSLWFESLAPALRHGEGWKAFLILAQFLGAVVGVGLAVVGLVRFLRAWLSMGWALSSVRDFLEASPSFAEIRQQPSPRERRRMVGALMARVLLLPGLGYVPLGLGIVVVCFNALDVDFPPDPVAIAWGIGFIALGLVQVIAQRLTGERE